MPRGNPTMPEVPEGAKSARELTILDEAKDIVFGRSLEEYGDTAQSFVTIAKLWSATLGHEVSAEDVALCLIQLKVARAANQHHDDGEAEGLIKRDSLIDIAGYAQCLAIIQSQP